MNEFPIQNLEKLETKDVKVVPIEEGETLIFLQRHADYDRQTGKLTELGAFAAKNQATRQLTEMIDSVPEGERQNICVMVVASPTIKNVGKRSVETAEEILAAVRETFQANNISKDNILTESPRETANIEEPRIFKDEDLRFFFYLTDKYSKGTPEFWNAFESDTESEKRKELDAEGPEDIADRFDRFNKVLIRYSKMFHRKYKGKRLLIWNVSHYDTISPFYKTRIANKPLDTHVPVDYLAGLSIKVDNSGEVSINSSDASISYK